jgi:hypothetical protein
MVAFYEHYVALFEGSAALTEEERSRKATSALYMLIWTKGAAASAFKTSSDERKVARLAFKLIRDGCADVNAVFPLP